MYHLFYIWSHFPLKLLRSEIRPLLQVVNTARMLNQQNACMPQAIHNKYTCLNSLHISGLWFDFQFFFSISIFKQMLET